MLRTSSLRYGLLLVLLVLAPGPALAADEPAEPTPTLPWVGGPGTVPIGDDLAELELPEGFVFLGGDGSRQLLELSGNPTDGSEVATVASASQDSGWFVIFEWEEIGYVEDDDAGAIDADAILASIREGTEAANEERRARGWPTLEIVGWHEEPHYDPATHNLTWAIIGESADGRTINRFVKLLGRRGVMTATLVAGPEDLAAAVPVVDGLLEGYSFRTGSRYAEFVPGQDRIAQIGLTALIAGGAGAALVKSGLLAKFWKPIAAGFAALAAAIGRLFRRKRVDPATTPGPIA